MRGVGGRGLPGTTWEVHFRLGSWMNWGTTSRNSKVIREVWISRKNEDFVLSVGIWEKRTASEHLSFLHGVWTKPYFWFQKFLFLPWPDGPVGILTTTEFYVSDQKQTKQLVWSPELIKIPRDVCYLRFLYVCFELNNSFWQAFSLQQRGSMFWWEGEWKSLWFTCFWVPAGGPALPWASLLFWTLEAILAQLCECQLVLEEREWHHWITLNPSWLWMEWFLPLHIPYVNMVASFHEVRAPSEFAIWTCTQVTTSLWLLLSRSVVEETYQVPGPFFLPSWATSTDTISILFFGLLLGESGPLHRGFLYPWNM